MLGSKTDAWIQISSGVATPIFLVFDFDLTSRTEAGFRDFARLLPQPLTIFQATQPPDSFSAVPPPRRYLDWWCEDIRDRGTRIGAVLGYCAGAVFASAVADELEVLHGTRPMVVLFNPGKPSPVTLSRDFESVIASMSPLTPDERAAAYREAHLVIHDEHNDFSSAADEISRLYGKFCSFAVERLSMGQDIGVAMAAVFRSYLSYLSAAREIEYRSAWHTAVALNSVEGDGDLDFARKIFPFPVSRGDLLRTREVAQVAYGLMRSGA